MKPKLIVLEGADGVGKSTQARILADIFNARIVAQPSGTNLVSYIRKEVKFNEQIKPFERQLLHTVSHVVDAFMEFAVETGSLVMDRCHISTYVYGQVTNMEQWQNDLLFKIHQDVYSKVLKDKFDITIVFLDREKKYKEEFTDNFEKSFAWENLRKLYLKKFDGLVDPEDHVFAPNERVFYKNVQDRTREELTQDLVQLVNQGV